MLMSDIDRYGLVLDKLKLRDYVSIVTAVSWKDIINLRRSKSGIVVS